jgi:hypothetical protein
MVKFTFAVPVMLTVLVAVPHTSAAQAAPAAQPAAVVVDPAGHWEGSINLPDFDLNIQVDLAKAAGKWKGTISIPQQNVKGLPLADISVAGSAVSFAMKGVPGDPRLKGTLSADGKAMTGDFTQGTSSMPFKLARTGDAKFEDLPKSTAITNDLEGSWEGALDIQGKQLRLVFKLARQADGTGSGVVISVDQGGAEIPIAAVIQNAAQVKILVPVVVGTYEGELKGGELTGTWTQGPNKWPLALKRK